MFSWQSIRVKTIVFQISKISTTRLYYTSARHDAHTDLTKYYLKRVMITCVAPQVLLWIYFDFRVNPSARITKLCAPSTLHVQNNEQQQLETDVLIIATITVGNWNVCRVLHFKRYISSVGISKNKFIRNVNNNNYMVRRGPRSDFDL